MISRRCALVVCALVLVACSPYDAHRDIANAEKALTSAEQAGAVRAAPYEYAAAREYFHKAKEEAAYSDFEGARVFAKRAVEYANQAQTHAEGGHVAESGKVEVTSDKPPPPPPLQKNAERPK